MNRSRVNWDMLEKRIGESEAAYQRPVIRRKIDELVAYYASARTPATLPAIPGAVIITSEKRFTFTPVAGHHDLGLLQIPEEHGVLRVLDGQHRLLALHALSQAGENMNIEVPAVLFDSLDARQIVELFVTINAKHTRLNPSHIIRPRRSEALSGRQPGAGPRCDSARSTRTTPRRSTARSRCSARARPREPGAVGRRDRGLPGDRREGRQQRQAAGAAGGAKRFFLNYIKALSTTFPSAWAGRKYSIKTGAALRAFIRTAPDVMARPASSGGTLRSQRDPRGDQAWGERLRDRRVRDRGRVEAEAPGGTRGTVEVLTRELREALR